MTPQKKGEQSRAISLSALQQPDGINIPAMPSCRLARGLLLVWTGGTNCIFCHWQCCLVLLISKVCQLDLNTISSENSSNSEDREWQPGNIRLRGTILYGRIRVVLEWRAAEWDFKSGQLMYFEKGLQGNRLQSYCSVHPSWHTWQWENCSQHFLLKLNEEPHYSRKSTLLFTVTHFFTL